MSHDVERTGCILYSYSELFVVRLTGTPVTLIIAITDVALQLGSLGYIVKV